MNVVVKITHVVKKPDFWAAEFIVIIRGRKNEMKLLSSNS